MELRTSSEIAMGKLPLSKNVIPRMTHPMSRYWRQPDLSHVLIDDTHALMDRPTFQALATYSTSVPTGAYEGKAWRVEGWTRGPNGEYTLTGKWYLRWYGYSEKSDQVSINTREIILV